jgi:polysaccharide export outer membrane protein
MKTIFTIVTILSLVIAFLPISHAQERHEAQETPKAQQAPEAPQYTVGIDDVLDISILQPEKLLTTVTVAPDGSISFPYIGNVQVKGMGLSAIQEDIQAKLADGYMKYPVVSVSLKASRSRKFFIYGEVIRPGAYPIEEKVTVLKAISMAGGFTRFGSSSRVKIIILQAEDLVIVSEGVF